MNEDALQRLARTVAQQAAPQENLLAPELEALKAQLREDDMDIAINTQAPPRPLPIHWLRFALAASVMLAAMLAVMWFKPGGGNNAGGTALENKPGCQWGDGRDGQNGKDGGRVVPPALVRHGPTGPDFRFSDFAPRAAGAAKADVKQYELPLDLSSIANAGNARVKRLLADAGAADLLRRNGFAVGGADAGVEFAKAYEAIAGDKAPVVITPDAVLHLYHICFDETLKDLEEQVFAWDMLDITRELLAAQTAHYQAATEPRLREALRANMAYLGVAYKLLGEMPRERKPGDGGPIETPAPAVKLHADIAQAVAEELQLMDKHDGDHVSPVFGYRENYSQYVPRGHYTRSELLKRYFLAVMWYGRMAFLFHEVPAQGLVYSETPVTREMADRMTLQAGLLASDIMAIKPASLPARPKFARPLDGVPGLHDLWRRVYACTAFFVGAADDLSPAEYARVLGDTPPRALLDVEALRKFQAGLEALPLPRIYGGTAQIMSQQTGDEVHAALLRSTQGLRLMGQRYVPDSEAMGRLVYPRVSRPLEDGATLKNMTCVQTQAGLARCFPRGLDVMALMGSARARELLRELKDDAYVGYDKAFGELEQRWRSMSDADWNQNLYYGWLNTLRPLLASAEARKGYPTFMQTKAYEDRLLTAAMASWAQLRHDTILYAKQSETPRWRSEEPLRAVGFVEPLPEFYERMEALCVMMIEGLRKLGALAEGAGSRLERLAGSLREFARMSRLELQGKELGKDDYDLIAGFSGHINYLLASEFGKVDGRALRTDIVADVHTDGNSKECLEVATGRLRIAAFAYFNPDGKLIVGFGPVLSFYEFRQPMNDRLTDEAWQKMLGSSAPAEPEWVRNFTGK